MSAATSQSLGTGAGQTVAGEQILRRPDIEVCPDGRTGGAWHPGMAQGRDRDMTALSVGGLGTNRTGKQVKRMSGHSRWQAWCVTEVGWKGASPLPGQGRGDLPAWAGHWHRFDQGGEGMAKKTPKSPTQTAKHQHGDDDGHRVQV